MREIYASRRAPRFLNQTWQPRSQAEGATGNAAKLPMCSGFRQQSAPAASVEATRPRSPTCTKVMRVMFVCSALGFVVSVAHASAVDADGMGGLVHPSDHLDMHPHVPCPCSSVATRQRAPLDS